VELDFGDDPEVAAWLKDLFAALAEADPDNYLPGKQRLLVANRAGDLDALATELQVQVLETTGGQNNVVGDVDGDGDLDVVLVESGAAARLLRNEAPRSNHAMRLRLRGVPDRVQGRTWSNVRGIGADVEVKAKDLLARRIVLCGSGFPGQATTDVLVGLGERSSADFVTVHWTDGVMQSEYGIAPDAMRKTNA
jgi:hypothetical protein